MIINIDVISLPEFRVYSCSLYGRALFEDLISVPFAGRFRLSHSNNMSSRALWCLFLWTSEYSCPVSVFPFESWPIVWNVSSFEKILFSPGLSYGVYHALKILTPIGREFPLYLLNDVTLFVTDTLQQNYPELFVEGVLTLWWTQTENVSKITPKLNKIKQNSVCEEEGTGLDLKSKFIGKHLLAHKND